MKYHRQLTRRDLINCKNVGYISYKYYKRRFSPDIYCLSTERTIPAIRHPLRMRPQWPITCVRLLKTQIVLQRSLSRLSSPHCRHNINISNAFITDCLKYPRSILGTVSLQSFHQTMWLRCTAHWGRQTSRQSCWAFLTGKHTTPNQHNRQSNKLRRCYSDLTIWNLGAVGHPDFTPWISTTARPSRTAPTYQISAQSGKPWLSYWWFNNFSRPVLEAIL